MSHIVTDDKDFSRLQCVLATTRSVKDIRMKILRVLGHRLVVQSEILAIRLEQYVIERDELSVVDDALGGLQWDVLREHLVVGFAEF